MTRAAGYLMALGAAALFGFANVVAKASGLPYLMLACGSYVVAGVALAPFLRGFRPARRDLLVLVAMALVGGALAPLALFAGLQRASAVDTSLLLTLELVFTAALAGVFLRERLHARGWAGAALLLGAALLVALAGGGAGTSTPIGLALVALAALGWGIDNTLSARLVGSYQPQHLAAIKGLLGGGALLVALLLLRAWEAPTAAQVAALLFIGLGAIGLSVVLYNHALRRIGATRTSAISIPTAALTGAIAAALLLREPLTALHFGAAALVVVGVLLAVRP